jgi:hypothetical protein
MSLCTEVLPPEQRAVLQQLGRAADDCGFYLAGGTAVAIHLGHRQSVDLDWFTGQQIDNPMDLARELQGGGVELQVGSVQRGTLHGDVGGVRVSFLEFGYPLLKPPVPLPPFDCTVASLEDLAAMKLLAVAQRGTKKDFLDVHALGTSAFPLGEMLALYRRKFSVEDIARLTYSLCYFDDADPGPMPTMVVDITWDQAKETIRSWVKALAGSSVNG